MDNKTIKILENIDLNIEPSLDKDKLLNLFELSKKNNINIFDEKKGKIKSKRKIIQECNNHKTKRIDTFIKVLDKKNNSKNKSTTKIKILNDQFMKELESIEGIIEYVNNSDFKILKDLSESKIDDTKQNQRNSSDNINLDKNNNKKLEENKNVIKKIIKDSKDVNGESLDYIEIYSNDIK